MYAITNLDAQYVWTEFFRMSSMYELNLLGMSEMCELIL
jgi:hypothetical protein